MTAEQEKLFNDNLGLAPAMVQKMTLYRKTFDEDDFHQIALMALWNAAKHFDPSHGIAFCTYACNSIKRNLYAVCMLPKYSRLMDKMSELHLEGYGESDYKLSDILPDTPIDLVEKVYARQVLDKFFSRCTEEQKRMISRICVDGISGAEYGREIGRGKATISKRLMAVRSILRECMNEAS